MFSCKNLSFLRNQDYDSSSTSSIFNGKGSVLYWFSLYLHHIILRLSPLLSAVRLHPLLVTQGREYEKTNARWKGLAEVHDVMAECSRYSLDVYETNSREDAAAVMSLWPDSAGSTPLTRNLKTLASVTSISKLILYSPPEAAVEATPDNTPYTTPVKDQSRQPLPAPIQVSRNLSFKSPGPSSPTKSVKSPTKESSPFKFPDPLERRDSLFGDMGQVSHPGVNKRDSLGLGIPSLRVKPMIQDSKITDPELDVSRPSPVKFTSDPPNLHWDKQRQAIPFIFYH